MLPSPCGVNGAGNGIKRENKLIKIKGGEGKLVDMSLINIDLISFQFGQLPRKLCGVLAPPSPLEIREFSKLIFLEILQHLNAFQCRF